MPQRGSGPQLGDFIDKLEGETKFNKKFNRIYWASKFAIKALPNNPDFLLLNIFQFCLDAAIHECTTKWTKPDHVGVMISSELLNPDIWIPIRPYEKEETVHVIMKMCISILLN
jgi:hypothetical protein